MACSCVVRTSLSRRAQLHEGGGACRSGLLCLRPLAGGSQPWDDDDDDDDGDGDGDGELLKLILQDLDND